MSCLPTRFSVLRAASWRGWWGTGRECLGRERWCCALLCGCACAQDDLSPELQAVTRIVGALQAMQQVRMPAALGGSAGEEEESKGGKDEKDKSGDEEQSKHREKTESRASEEKGGAAEADSGAADSRVGGEGEAPDGAEEETEGGGAGKDETNPEAYEPCVPGRVIFIERCGLGAPWAHAHILCKMCTSARTCNQLVSMRSRGHTLRSRRMRQPYGTSL